MTHADTRRSRPAIARDRSHLAVWCVFAALAGALAGCGSDEREAADAVRTPTLLSTPLQPSAQPHTDVLGRTGGERLVAEPPAGWVVHEETRESARRAVEFRPDVSTEAAVEWVRFEAFTTSSMPEPLAALATVAERARDDCPDLDHFNTSSGEENNYAIGTALLVCRDDPAGGARIDAVKAIRGNDHWYLIHRSRPVPRLAAPSADGDGIAQLHEELADAVSMLSFYVRSASLCDDRHDAHPCAAPGTTGG